MRKVFRRDKGQDVMAGRTGRKVKIMINNLRHFKDYQQEPTNKPT